MIALVGYRLLYDFLSSIIYIFVREIISLFFFEVTTVVLHILFLLQLRQ